MTPRAWLSAAVAALTIYAPTAAALGLITWWTVLAAFVFVGLLPFAVWAVRWAGVSVHISSDHPDALGSLDELQRRHHKP